MALDFVEAFDGVMGGVASVEEPGLRVLGCGRQGCTR